MKRYGDRAIPALVQTALAAAAGSLIYAFWNMPLWAVSLEFPLWLAVVAATTIPVAFLGVALPRLLSMSSWHQGPILAATCSVGIVSSILLFESYMSWLSPALNWSRGSLLPAASFTSGFALAVLKWPTFNESEKRLVAGSA